uniref:Uncharacterized protein n=1 Tax=Eutreptiella gymnastica TaxID=73025 RepID=A0A7S1IAZ3_9EUGL
MPSGNASHATHACGPQIICMHTDGKGRLPIRGPRTGDVGTSGVCAYTQSTRGAATAWCLDRPVLGGQSRPHSVHRRAGDHATSADDGRTKRLWGTNMAQAGGGGGSRHMGLGQAGAWTAKEAVAG